MRSLLFAVLFMATSPASFASPVTYKTVELNGL